MAKLISQLVGGQLAGFVLVLSRVAPLFVIAPLFSAKVIPARVKGIIAVAISIGLTPVAMQGQHIPGSVISLGALTIEGILTGLGFSFSIAVLFAAIESASAFVDVISGFSLGGVIDPMNGGEGGVFAQFYSVVGVVIFLVIGGDAWLLRGIARTFELVPLTSGPRLGSLVNGAAEVFSTVFSSALEIVAPVLLAMLITDVAFGVVSRVVPQLNVFAVGFPTKVVVALLLVSATIPFTAGWISGQLSSSVGAALEALHVA